MTQYFLLSLYDRLDCRFLSHLEFPQRSLSRVSRVIIIITKHVKVA